MSNFQLNHDFLKKVYCFFGNTLKFDVSKIIEGKSKIKAP